MSIIGKTSLKSLFGTESNRQVVGLEDETSDFSSERFIEESGPNINLVLQVVLWFLN